ncbi:proteinase/capsid scaffold protein [Equid gammaherpesvirus 5]|uniref:Capsid scaffolding protein n=2 Tax=Equid gammaherpesvirus 5 TaxID=10371 RepID=A0A0B4Q6Q1_9GAMA|nr:capsid maturation protease [Equid gammaherpesvirus 5]AIU39541.1 capsid maturation protease [Equid gammaherpesvirus 5]APT43378.1 proteinase/capsid scaffold protein [Equid gammaherpesvirus 5]
MVSASSPSPPSPATHRASLEPSPPPPHKADIAGDRAPVYVGGFVDVFSYPKDSRALYLDPREIKAHLPLSDPIPLNVEHIHEAQVGWTLGLHATDYGLFCVGVITAADFFALVERLCAASSVARVGSGPLPPNPVLEMLHTWLPELSLSSVHPDSIPDALNGNSPIFQHVSLCAMGLRRGTVAVYGESVEWILSKFTSLTQAEKKAIATRHASLDPASLPRPLFTCSNEILMAKAIDAGFIKNRLEILKTDKGVAEVNAPTYLKASVQGAPANLEEEKERDSAPKPGACPPSPPATTEPIMNQQQFSAQAPAGVAASDDLITVPRSTFMTMLQTNLDTMRQTCVAPRFGQQAEAPAAAAAPPSQMRLPIVSPFPPAHSGYYPMPYHFQPPMDVQADTTYVPYVHVPPPGVLPPFAPHMYGGLMAPPTYSPVAHPARPGKRKRDGEDDYESGPLFPGEIQRDFQSLSKSIAALQSEIKDIKNASAGQQLQPQPYLPPPPPTIYHSAPGDAAAAQGYYVRYVSPYQAPVGGAQCVYGPQGVVEHAAPNAAPQGVHQVAPQATGGATANSNGSCGQSAPCDTKEAGCGQPPQPQPQAQPQQQPQPPQQPPQVVVEASTKPSQISQLQKIFCEELLNKT